MGWVTPKVALGIFVVIIIAAAIISFTMKNYETYDKGTLHTFIAILAGLGVFVTFMFYFSVIELQQQQQELSGIQELARINNAQLNSVLTEIKTASSKIPSFVLSITPLTNTICKNTIPIDPVDPELCTMKMVLSYRIFSLWQDVIVSNYFLKVDSLSYISNFLQYANSRQLKDQWKVSKLNFTADVQKFGDLLFEYGLKITKQTPEAYILAAKQLMCNPKYKEIFPNRLQEHITHYKCSKHLDN